MSRALLMNILSDMQTLKGGPQKHGIISDWRVVGKAVQQSKSLSVTVISFF